MLSIISLTKQLKEIFEMFMIFLFFDLRNDYLWFCLHPFFRLSFISTQLIDFSILLNSLQISLLSSLF